MMDMHVQRHGRIDVEIPVTITTVLDSFDAAIVDLNEHGAQIMGCAVATGTRFQIEYMGQTVFAQCRWAEIDRMGVKFFDTLADGPLFERLLIAQASRFPGAAPRGTAMACSPMQPRVGAGRGSGRIVQGGFGRRTG